MVEKASSDLQVASFFLVLLDLCLLAQMKIKPHNLNTSVQHILVWRETKQFTANSQVSKERSMSTIRWHAEKSSSKQENHTKTFTVDCP